MRTHGVECLVERTHSTNRSTTRTSPACSDPATTVDLLNSPANALNLADCRRVFEDDARFCGAVLRVNLAVPWWNELAGAVTIRTRSDGSEVYSTTPASARRCDRSDRRRARPRTRRARCLLVVIAVNEHADRAVARMIILTGSESRHLFAVLVVAPCCVLAAPQAWSDWC